MVPVKLYFGVPDASGVAPEIRWLPAGDAGALRRLEALLEGPKDPDLSPSIPPTATIRSVTVVGDRAIVDFGSEIIRDHPGGSAGEIITVYSVVNTLTELPAVRWVDWRVDGRPVETLVGHLDLSTPIARNEEVVVDLEAHEWDEAPRRDQTGTSDRRAP